MSDQAKAEKAAREKLLAAINLLRCGQGILQFAEWEHDPFLPVIEGAKSLYESLNNYSEQRKRQ